MVEDDEAERAYQAAVRVIEERRKEGRTRISFGSALELRSLERIPPEIVLIHGLDYIDLDMTKVSDLSPLSALTGLREFWLNSTRVSDLSPLSALTGLRALHLDGTKVRDLTQLARLTELETLSLRSTAVSDLEPLTALTRLEFLSLSHTPVRDLSPLAKLHSLERLDIEYSRVSDLSPLAALTGLKLLSLHGTNVSDLRPIRDLALTSMAGTSGLMFFGTAATRNDPELARLADIVDIRESTTQTLAYLKTLPPWPEPLPWLEPPIPEGQSAPLQVVEVDGVLRPDVPGTGLDGQAQDLARQGYHALRDYLADLAPIRPRLDNHVPTLGRALARLETALGAAFEAGSIVAVGTHGQRVIRLASATGDSGLAEDDKAELQEFAVALSLYLERFPEWRDYRAGALARPVEPARLEKTLPAIASIEAELMDRREIDPAIPSTLRDLRALAAEEPSDAVANAGLLDSLGNVLAALAHGMWRGIKATGRGVAWFLKNVATETAKLAAKGIAAVAADVFLVNGAVLKTIAANFPQHLGWLVDFLRFLGI